MEEALPRKKQNDDAPKVPWWKHPTVLIAGVCALVAIGLIVGLSVGLTQGDKATNTTDETLPPPLSPKITLQAIGTDSLTPYPDCQALQDDLEAAALYLANSQIDSSARSYYHNEWRPVVGGRPDVDGEAGDTTADDAAGDPAPDPGAGGEDSYQTNVQVEGVDEADFVKSDGEHVFAIYGNEIVCWDVDNVAMRSRTPVAVDFNVTGPVEYGEYGGYGLWRWIRLFLIRSGHASLRRSSCGDCNW